MNITAKLSEYKVLLSLIVVVVGATFGVLTWASEQLEQQQLVIEAKAALIHNEAYQESRIARKQDQITEHNRELDNLLEYMGEEEPTRRQTREIAYLDEEIAKLRQQIEDIQVLLETS